MLKSDTSKKTVNDNSSHESIRARLSGDIAANRYAQQIIESLGMAREGQRLHRAAMDAAEKIQEAADERTQAIEACAVAEGVDLTDVLYLVDQQLYGPALEA